jgi:uncharacterized protein YdiU (UPF0061 family)
VESLLELMNNAKLDYTVFFRTLSKVDIFEDIPFAVDTLLAKSSYKKVPVEQRDELLQWLRAYQSRTKQDGVDAPNRSRAMSLVNPKYILRNYYAQLAIDGAEGRNYEYLEGLYKVLQNPYEEGSKEEEEKYAVLPPVSSLSIKCSCSS